MIQLIKGIDITLYGITEQTINNVLVGEPSSDGLSYTIALPKGTSFDLADTIIGFFGRRFRVIGLASEGMEINIPLAWNAKYRVEQLVTTGYCTVYDSAYSKHVFSDVLYTDSRGIMQKKVEAQTADSVNVKIYSCSSGDGYIPKAGDIIVDGQSSFSFVTTSEQTISESMLSFRQQYGNPVVIKQVTKKLCGKRFDYDITAR